MKMKPIAGLLTAVLFLSGCSGSYAAEQETVHIDNVATGKGKGVADEQIIPLVMVKNKALPLCREVDEILRLPVNKDYLKVEVLRFDDPAYKEKLDRFGRMFVIPATYRNFSFPRWQKIDMEEVKRELPQTFEREKEDEEWRKKKGIEYEYKKALVDVDNDGHRDVLYSAATELTFSELTTSKNEQKFNKRLLYPSHGFYYKGRFFISRRYAGDMVLFEPHQLQSERGYYLKYVCVWRGNSTIPEGGK